MTSCCQAPRPSRFRVESSRFDDQPPYVVLSECETCHSTRQESPYCSTREIAESMIGRIRADYAWRRGDEDH